MLMLDHISGYDSYWRSRSVNLYVRANAYRNQIGIISPQLEKCAFFTEAIILLAFHSTSPS